MLNRHNRLLVTVHVLSDSLLAVTAFLLTYYLRFHTGLIPAPKGIPPLEQYINLLPFIAVLVPVGFQLQGLYRLRRGRSRVDDFFAVLVGSILAVVFGIVATIYVEIYFATPAARDRGAFEVSQAAWAIFLVLNVALTFTSREVVREALERRWRAGIGLKRILIAGSGELGRLVADKILEHRELGYQIVGFVDDRASGDHLGYRGLPLLGTIDDAADICQRESVDHLYVALPPEQHVRMLQLIDSTSREFVDVKVVPDLLQVIALRARLEDLDGIPVININDVPLQGFNSIVKRAIDIAISFVALVALTIPFSVIAALIKLTSRGPVFYRQLRMGLDGSPFMIYKFRSMYDDAEADTGPVFASDQDPRRTPVGRVLRQSNVDELPQFWNVLRGEMSIVGPRPERPNFVAEFKHKIPQYMLRHKVKAGITGWAQVNGWRGNTSIEKRIEYDLYYIENWSVRLDLKIMWLTLLRGFFHKPAY
ncbi:MAG: undecaprenyl-phosphate glucose phosphotransferase [Acidobacteria bacterium 13_1_40CM_65_14]|nr:MAG: undecaprenyl-phosphate glucose phosphotransferase [Acidobacteria bacterium 13_1_40CM_65_14]OLC78410.1 MAG: undecaprenyl-phosphate glucose phosphotransferase [Acidobacteria bacterium 13_1_40CM_4_65_8]OLE83438.1 MAG: undecaprenyl-phosphate glucose phosphotransferase [Acidobacteria bacterium 13_1_20CM_2_65_9]